MSHRNDEERLDEIIGRAVDIGRVEFDRTKWLDKLAARQSGSDGQPMRCTKSEPHKKLWRTIMESRITKYSVAATLVLTTSLVLLNPVGRSGVVLADVAQKLSETRTVTHRESRLAWRLGEDEPFFKAEVRKYFSSDVGMMEEQYDPNGLVLHRIYFLKEPQETVIVLPPTRKYLRLPAPSGIYEEFVKMMVPAGLVNYFISLPYTTLGRSHFRQFEVEGFEAAHIDLPWLPAYAKYLFPIQDLTARLLIDVETTLPVGIEMEIDAGRGLMNGFQKMRVEFTAYDFHWNAELPQGVFDPNVPADYTQIDLGSIASENAAWLGIGGALPVVGIIIHRRRRRTRSRLGKTLTTT